MIDMINNTRWTVPRYYVGPFTRLERVPTCPRSPHVSVPSILRSYHMLLPVGRFAYPDPNAVQSPAGLCRTGAV